MIHISIASLVSSRKTCWFNARVKH